MEIETIRRYFNDTRTVEHYLKAVANVGLWESERIMVQKYLSPRDRILDLGCGAGRLSIGLAQLGYGNLHGVDLADGMVAQASEIAQFLGLSIAFQREDATRLSFADESFDAVVFAFNGLMQIPGSRNRLDAVREVARVLKREGLFVFTSLDREGPLYRKVFADKKNYEHSIAKNPALLEYGDRHFETTHGTTFMHVPTREEVLSLVAQSGLEWVEDCMRSSLALENGRVLEFSEDCRFWVFRA